MNLEVVRLGSNHMVLVEVPNISRDKARGLGQEILSGLNGLGVRAIVIVDGVDPPVVVTQGGAAGG